MGVVVAGAADFTGLLIQRGAELVDREAYCFVSDTCTADARPGEGLPLTGVSVSYGELDRSAKRIASWLQQFRPVGQRVVLCHGDSVRFIEGFLGCLYAGAVPVPAPAPSGGPQADARLVGILKDSAARFVLTDSAHAPAVSQLLASAGQPEVFCLATDRSGFGDPGVWTRPPARPDEPVFLQYTSGSVSEPKGVVVSHANLLANQRAIQSALGTTEHSRIGGWLPFHHDMGLVGQLLHPLFLGATGVLLPPLSFAKQPVRWLQMIDQYDITVTGAPDFAYELCARQVTDEQVAALDLSRLEVAVSGAEPVQAETLDAFAERFAPAGLRAEALRPGYGMAEATLLVAMRAANRRPSRWTVDAAALAEHRVSPPRPDAPSRTLVSVGSAIDEIDLLIVDPEKLLALPDGQVGEIWIRGAGVAGGYWNQPQHSVVAFHARPSSARNQPAEQPAHRAGGFLRTGDLGFLVKGELFVTGRLTEVLNVAGRNLYPQDIERRVQKLSVLFGSASAFAVGSERDQVVVVQEVRAGGDADAEFPALVSAVQQCVAQEFDITAHNVLLVRPGTVRRTTSGKLQRAAMRQLFLAGRIQPLHEVVSGEMPRLVCSAAGGSGSGDY